MYKWNESCLQAEFLLNRILQVFNEFLSNGNDLRLATRDFRPATISGARDLFSAAIYGSYRGTNVHRAEPSQR